ncbi:phosphate acyltransferase [Candidatus Saccharibacteria bacterium]|nr:phosphate acyltransferase [Candidatus Saccharibacteria bacterium]
MKNLVFPEGNNEFIKTAAEQLKSICNPILLDGDLNAAVQMVKDGEADVIVAGIDHSTRDVILAVRDGIGVAEGQKTFASLFVCDFPDGQRFILSDGGVCKNPTEQQLADIIILNHFAAQKILDTTPKIAMLSFSTFGSGGKDPSIDKVAEAMTIAREKHPEILVDGEMQLDAAVNPRIAAKKSGDSKVAGEANVLITPDLNSGNILYKSFEQFAHATVAGPILLGFAKPASDLSRGSTVEDIVLTAKCVLALAD